MEVDSAGGGMQQVPDSPGAGRERAKSIIDIKDEEAMQKMGYKQELNRGLGEIMNFAFGFTEVACLISVALVFTSPGLSDGGPSSIIWSFFVCFFCTYVISRSMGEICAAYPSAGCVYHWAAQLVPPQFAAISSYMTGWANFLGNAAGDAAFANGFTLFVSAASVACGGNPIDPQPQVGVSIAVLMSWTVLNYFEIEKVGFLNNIAAGTQIVSLLLIVFGVPLCSAQTASGSFVFTSFMDLSTANWPDVQSLTNCFSKTYVCCVGITTALFTFAGYEASGHMSEETHNAAEAAPKGLVNTVLATGFGAAGLYLALLFSLSYPVSYIPFAQNTTTGQPLPYYNQAYAAFYGYDADPAALPNVASLWVQPPGTYLDTTTCSMRTSTGNGVINLFMQATSGRGSSCNPAFGRLLSVLLVINAFFAGLSSVSVTGRITYAMARDNGFPLSQWMKRVSERFHTPINALNFVMIFDALLLLLNLNTNGGSAAFLAIVGLCTIGFQISYGLPVLFKLLCRPRAFPKTNPVDGSPLPWQLGSWSIPCAILSCLWLFGSSVFFFFPASGPVNTNTINNNDAVFFNDFTSCVPYFGTQPFSNCSSCPYYAVAQPSNVMLTYTDATNTTTQAVFLNGQQISNTTTSNINNMQWLIVVVFGVVAVATINWLTNSRYHFKGPRRVNDVPRDTYYFAWKTYTPEFYDEFYPDLLQNNANNNNSSIGGEAMIELGETTTTTNLQREALSANPMLNSPSATPHAAVPVTPHVAPLQPQHTPPHSSGSSSSDSSSSAALPNPAQPPPPTHSMFVAQHPISQSPQSKRP